MTDIVPSPGPYVFLYRHADVEQYAFKWSPDGRGARRWFSWVFHERRGEWKNVELDEVWESAVTEHFKLEKIAGDISFETMARESPHSLMLRRRNIEQRYGEAEHSPVSAPGFPGAGTPAIEVA